MEGIKYIIPNKKAEKLLGYTKEELLGMNTTQIHPQEELEKVIHAFKEIVKGTADSCHDTKILRKDGTSIPVDITGTNIEYAGQKVVQGIFMDITGRKQAEQHLQMDKEQLQRLLAAADQSRKALLSLLEDQRAAQEAIRRLNEELEARVLQRTAQLDAVNKELEAFSYSVSHDLRAPLRSIEGFSNALLEDYQDRPLDETGRKYLERVCKTTQHMGFLIDDMLKLSHVTRFEFKCESIDLSDMIRKTARKLQESAPDRSVIWVVQDGVVIQGDQRLLQIALSNLLDNAWKFTGRQAQPRIEFGATVKDGDPVYYVRDNGVGFDMAYVNKLFGAFQRLHTTEEFAGTGIGLATVRRIINRHGGRVWAEGEIGKGATLYFTIA
ncbi:MAG: ATP-binding protein [Pseudomonadota bacterium]